MKIGHQTHIDAQHAESGRCRGRRVAIFRAASVLVVGFGGLVGTAAQAQSEISAPAARMAQPSLNMPGAPMKCPQPNVITLVKISGPTAHEPADIPANFKPVRSFNDSRVDAHFGDTLRWRLPEGLCCEVSNAVVTWTVKNNSSNALQQNDTTGLWFNKAPIVTHQIGALAGGASKTYTQALTPEQVANGRVTILAQDDTAVTEIRVRIESCCVRPTKMN